MPVAIALYVCSWHLWPKIFGGFVYHVPRNRFVLKVSIAIGKTAGQSLLLGYSILSIPGNV